MLLETPSTPLGAALRATLRVTVAASALVAATGASASAQLVFTDRATFESALGAFQRYYAADVPPNPPVHHSIDAVGPLSVVGFSDLWVIPYDRRDLDHAYAPGPRAAVFGHEPDAPLNDIPQTILRSPVPLYAFGIDYGIPELPAVFGLSTFSFSFNNGLSYERIGNPTGAPDDPNKTFEFFGLITAVPFTEITFRVDNDECSGYCAWNSASWDAITVAAVPEPGTVALLATGLVGVAAAARRRRRS